MIHHTSRRPHNDLYCFQCLDLSADLLSAVNRQNLNSVHIFSKFPKFLGSLDRKLSGRAQHDCLNIPALRICILQKRYSKCCRLSGARLSLSDHILPCKQRRNRLLLYRCKPCKSHFCKTSDDPLIHAQLLRLFFNLFCRFYRPLRLMIRSFI